mmetsp:Transcript_35424/g.69915  ORF Transcript_35424/g.69915 Transcript_35424/m.69915 type:complete len:143 (-) Transcript_35424:403-831(-)
MTHTHIQRDQRTSCSFVASLIPPTRTYQQTKKEQLDRTSPFLFPSVVFLVFFAPFLLACFLSSLLSPLSRSPVPPSLSDDHQMKEDRTGQRAETMQYRVKSAWAHTLRKKGGVDRERDGMEARKNPKAAACADGDKSTSAHR